MPLPSIGPGDAIPPDGEFEILSDGALVGAVVKHPRQEGQWLVMLAPKDWRESGMKRYRTRSGAVRRVQQFIADRGNQ